MPLQSFVGRVNVVGDCCCFGAALHHETLIYLDIAGASTSVEAVAAKLSKGDAVHLIPPQDAAKIECKPAEKASFSRIQQKNTLGIHHLLLLHKSIQQPVYGETGATYMIVEDKEMASAMLGHHILNLVKIALYPAWYRYLVKRGREAGLLHKCRCYGGVDIWAVSLNRAGWENLIMGGLRLKEIQLPD